MANRPMNSMKKPIPHRSVVTKINFLNSRICELIDFSSEERRGDDDEGSPVHTASRICCRSHRLQRHLLRSELYPTVASVKTSDMPFHDGRSHLEHDPYSDDPLILTCLRM